MQDSDLVWLAITSINVSVVHSNGTLLESFVPRQSIRRNTIILVPWFIIFPATRSLSQRSTVDFQISASYPTPTLSLHSVDGQQISLEAPIELELRFTLSLYLDRDSVHTEDHPQDRRTLFTKFSFVPGLPSPKHSQVTLPPLLMAVDDTTKVLVHLRDQFGVPAEAHFRSGEESQNIIDFRVEESDTNPSVRVMAQSAANLKEGDSVSSLELELEALVPGTGYLHIEIDDKPVAMSPYNYTVELPDCFGDNEMFSEDESHCLCHQGHRRNGNAQCVPCQEGEYLPDASNENQCLPCGNGYFSTQAATECTSCDNVAPPRAVQCGDGRLRMRSGFWCERCADQSNHSARATVINTLQKGRTVVFHQCEPGHVCTVNAFNFTAECAKGHQGPLCDVCKSGHVKVSNGECVPCGDDTQNLVQTFAGGMVLVLFVIGASTLHLREELKASKSAMPQKVAPEPDTATSNQINTYDEHIFSKGSTIEDVGKQIDSTSNKKATETDGGPDKTNKGIKLETIDPSSNDNDTEMGREPDQIYERSSSKRPLNLEAIETRSNDENRDLDDALGKPSEDISEQNLLQQKKPILVSREDSPKAVKLLIMSFVDYLQIMSLFRSLLINPFRATQEGWDRVTELATLNPSSASPFRCTVSLSTLYLTISQMMTPWICCVLTFLVHTMLSFVAYGRRTECNSINRRFIRTGKELLGLLHMSVASAALQVFDLYPEKIHSSERLRSDISFVAGSQEYWNLLIASSATLVIFVFGFPVTMAIYFHYRYHTIKDGKDRQLFQKLIPGFRMNEAAFLFPVIEMLRKTCVLVISIFVPRAYEQFTTATAVLILSFGIVWAISPYRVKALTYVDLFKVVSAIVTCYLGALLHADGESDAPWITGAVIAVQITVFVVYIVVLIYIIPAAYNSILAKILPMIALISRAVKKMWASLPNCKCKLALRECHGDKEEPNAEENTQSNSELESLANQEAEEFTGLPSTPLDAFNRFLCAEDIESKSSGLNSLLHMQRTPARQGNSLQHECTPTGTAKLSSPAEAANAFLESNCLEDKYAGLSTLLNERSNHCGTSSTQNDRRDDTIAELETKTYKDNANNAQSDVENTGSFGNSFVETIHQTLYGSAPNGPITTGKFASGPTRSSTKDEQRNYTQKRNALDAGSNVHLQNDHTSDEVLKTLVRDTIQPRFQRNNKE